MAIAFSCSCGRKINAKDEHAGKKAKCPGCGQVVTVPGKVAAGAVATAAAAKPAAAAPRAKPAAPKPAPVDDDMYDLKEDAPPAPKKSSRAPAAAAAASPWGDDEPGLEPVAAPRAYVPSATGAAPAAPRGKGGAAAAAPAAGGVMGTYAALGSKRGAAPTPKGAKLAGGFHLGGFAKFIIGAAILLPTTFFIVRQGPVKAVAEWDKAEVDGENDIRSVLARTIHEMDVATMPPPDPDDKDGIPYHPQVEHFFFVDPPTIMWRMPDTIEFEGRTTFGDYKGVYWTRKREVECEMEWKGSDKLKLQAKCNSTGNIDKLLVDGIDAIAPTAKMELSKKFDGHLAWEAEKAQKKAGAAAGGGKAGKAGDDE